MSKSLEQTIDKLRSFCEMLADPEVSDVECVLAFHLARRACEELNA